MTIDPKAAVGGVGAAAATLLWLLLAAFVPAIKDNMDAAAIAAATGATATIVGFVLAYLVPNGNPALVKNPTGDYPDVEADLPE